MLIHYHNKILLNSEKKIKNYEHIQHKQIPLMLSELSHVGLFATPWTIQSMEFSRPEYWSG